MDELKIFEYIPGDHKQFGNLIVRLPGSQPTSYDTTNHAEVEQYMIQILKYYSDLLTDIRKSAEEIKNQLNT